MSKKIKLADYIKEDKNGRYFLIESNGVAVEGFNNITRKQAYNKLVDIGFINEDLVKVGGIKNMIVYINRVLDGSLYISRFKFYRVSEKTKTLDKQLYEEQFRYIKEGL